MIGMEREKKSGKSVLSVRLDDIYIYIYIGCFKRMLTFLRVFLYDIIISKSPSVHHPYQHINGIFPRWSP